MFTCVHGTSTSSYALDVGVAVAEGEGAGEHYGIFESHPGAGAEVGAGGVCGVAEEGEVLVVVGEGGGVLVAQTLGGLRSWVLEHWGFKGGWAGAGGISL